MAGSAVAFSRQSSIADYSAQLNTFYHAETALAAAPLTGPGTDSHFLVNCGALVKSGVNTLLSSSWFGYILPTYGQSLSAPEEYRYYTPAITGDINTLSSELSLLQPDTIYRQLSSVPPFQGVHTPLINIIAERNNEKVLNAFLERLSPEQSAELVKISNAFGQTPLHDAFQKGNTGSISIWRKKLGIEAFVRSLNQKDNLGNTPIHLAIIKKQFSALQASLSAKGEHFYSWAEHFSQNTAPTFLTSNGLEQNALHLALATQDDLSAQFILDNVIPALDENQLSELLTLRDNQGETPFSLMLKQYLQSPVPKQLSEAKQLLDKVSPETRLQILTNSNHDSVTPLHLLAQLPHGHSLSLQPALYPIPNAKLPFAYVVQDKHGKNILQETLSHSRIENANQLCLLINQLDQSFRHGLMKHTDQQGDNTLHYLAALPNDKSQATVQFFEKYFPAKTQQEIAELLSAQNAKGQTPVHIAIESGNQALASQFLRQYLTPEGKATLSQLLQTQDTTSQSLSKAHGHTLLHLAVQKGFSSLLQEALAPFSAEERYALLAQRNSKGETVLHTLIRSQHVGDSLKAAGIIKNSLDDDPTLWPKLVKQLDNWGNTVLHDAASNKSFIKFIFNTLPISEMNRCPISEVRCSLPVTTNHHSQTPIHLAMHDLDSLVTMTTIYQPWEMAEIITKFKLLQVAERQGDQIIFDFLLKRMRTPGTNQITHHFKSALLENDILGTLIENHRFTWLNIIIESAPDVIKDYRNARGENILHIAAHDIGMANYFKTHLAADSFEQLLILRDSHSNQKPYEVASKKVQTLYLESLPATEKEKIQETRSHEQQEATSYLTPLFLISSLTAGVLAKLFGQQFISHQWTPLHYAARSADTDTFSTLLVEHGNHLNSTSHDGLTPLAIAIRHNNQPVIDLLIEAGGTLNPHKPYETPLSWLTYPNWTPLHFAAKNGSPKLVEYLLEQGADVKRRDGNGKTPLDIAQQYAQTIGVTTLLSLDALWDEQNTYSADPKSLDVGENKGPSLLPLYQHQAEQPVSTPANGAPQEDLYACVPEEEDAVKNLDPQDIDATSANPVLI